MVANQIWQTRQFTLRNSAYRSRKSGPEPPTGLHWSYFHRDLFQCIWICKPGHHIEQHTASVHSGSHRFVVAADQADAKILAEADLKIAYGDSGYTAHFNGDDVRALAKIVTAGSTETDTFDYYGTDIYLQVIDVIGLNNGVRPSGGWDVAGVTAATKDHTLVRKDAVTMPNNDWAKIAGTDSLSSEYLVYAKNTWDYVGWHMKKPVTPQVW